MLNRWNMQQGSMILCMVLLSGCSVLKQFNPMETVEEIPMETTEIVENADPDCQELLAEIRQLDNALADVDMRGRAVGFNNGDKVFWVPGVVYTHDAGEAINHIMSHKTRLTKTYEGKCRVVKDKT